MAFILVRYFQMRKAFMKIPSVYFASAIAVFILILALSKLLKPQDNPSKFIEIENEPAEKIKTLPQIISIYLIPQKPILGEALLQFFLNHKLQFSEKQKIFHAVTQNHKQFYVATLSSPGTFDITKMISETYVGLSFFTQPANSKIALDDFDALCQVLFDAKETFNAKLQSEKKVDISLDQLRDIREQISQQ